MAAYTVKPGGGGDFADLATALAAVGASDSLTLFAGNVGGGTIADANVSISVDASARCNPLIDAGDTGFAYTTGAITVSNSGATIEYLRTRGDLAAILTGSAMTSLAVRSCQLGNAGIAIGFEDASVTGVVVENCVEFATNGLGVTFAPFANGGNATSTATFRNCTFRSTDDTGAAGFYVGPTATAARVATANITISNVIVSGYAALGDFAAQAGGAGGTETINWTNSNNASSDGTANDFGGTGHLVDQSAASWFRNPASDLRLQAGSPGIDAGVTIGAVTTDAIGTARPQGAAYDIGAHEFTPDSASPRPAFALARPLSTGLTRPLVL